MFCARRQRFSTGYFFRLCGGFCELALRFHLEASEGKILTLTIINRSTSISVQRKSFNILCSPHGIVAESSFKHLINFRRIFTAYGQNLPPTPCSFKSAIREMRLSINTQKIRRRLGSTSEGYGCKTDQTNSEERNSRTPSVKGSTTCCSLAQRRVREILNKPSCLGGAQVSILPLTPTS